MTDEPSWREKYLAYIQSPEWREKRQLVRRRSKCICEMPGCRRKSRHVHHRTYVRLGHELLSDLIDLCDLCHQKEHPHRKLFVHPVRRIMRQVKKKRNKFRR